MKKILLLSGLLLMLSAACKSKPAPAAQAPTPPAASQQKPQGSFSDAVNTALAATPGAQDSFSPDCSQISGQQFIALGDAIMGSLAGDETHHSVMENAMGGENNAMTMSAHTKLGELYLNCPIGADNQGMTPGNEAATSTMAGSTGTMPEGTAASTTMSSGAMAQGGSMGDMDLIAIKRSAALGEYLTDPAGKTLYTFANDSQGVSNCSGQCLTAWPALATKSTGAAVSSMYQNLSVIQRADGTSQLAWKGMPLYYYAQDQMAGDATGQSMGGVWFAAKP